jgi:hypothetical protein
MRIWATDEVVLGVVDRHDSTSTWFARDANSRRGHVVSLWADEEGIRWCRGSDLNSPAACALRVAVAL